MAFEPEGGPQCRGRDTILKRSSRSCVRWTFCRRKGRASPMRSARRQEYGGLKSDQVKRLKALETENAGLRKAISDLTLDKLILREGCPGKLLSPARRRAVIDHVRSVLHLSERRTCAALGQHRSTQRKVL